jgi:hypothetical protein
MRTRRLAVRILLVLGAAAAPSVATPSAFAQAPEAQAWWSITSPAPPPPDVGKNDLLVQGGKADDSGKDDVPLAARGGAAAISGLRFAVPRGQRVGGLTLTLKGISAPRVTVRACMATESFGSEQNGSFRDVPAYDCARSAAGSLSEDASKLVFDDLGRLQRGGTLALVLLPGDADRLVISKPGADALTTQADPDTDLPADPSTSLPLKSDGGPPPMGGVDAPPDAKEASAPRSRVELPEVAPPAERLATKKTALPAPLHGLPARVAVLIALAAVLIGFCYPLLQHAMPLTLVIGGTDPPLVLGGPRSRRPRGVGRFVTERRGRPPRL